MIVMPTLTAQSQIARQDNAETAVELSIIMPCLNEAETLANCIVKAKRSLKELNIVGEIIVADNGSTDGSQAIACSLGARVVNVASIGYGSALMGGINASRGKYIIMGDADDSYDFSALGPFVEKLRAGYELVMGNRFKGGIERGAMPILHRYFGNPLLSGIGRIFFHSPCRDFQCGLRGFDKESITRLDLRTTGMEFASEMVVKATLCDLQIAEVATTLSRDGRSRPPHLRTWSDGWRYLRFMLLYSPRWLFLYPGLTLILLGLTAGTSILPGPLAVGKVNFDVHTMLYAAAAIVIGFQAVTFAVFTQTFAVSEGLLPEDPWLNRLFRRVALEGGILVGALLVLFGLGASIYALSDWGMHSFGPLDPFKVFRLIIPAVTSLILGCQTVLSSFFLSVLRLRRRRS
jgi:glycosyltransferase involved in cell wall biosynthesis